MSWKNGENSECFVCLTVQETVEHQGMLLILMDALQNLEERANTYTSKASLGMN